MYGLMFLHIRYLSPPKKYTDEIQATFKRPLYKKQEKIRGYDEAWFSGNFQF